MEETKTLNDYANNIQEASSILFQFPGVVRIGFGLKEQNNRIIPEYVYRVYVEKKLPLSLLSPEQIIPSEINGIKTDVIQIRNQHLVSSCKTKISPGMKISKLAFNVTMESGSIGCFLKRADDANRYLLTNDHVLKNDEEMDPVENRVYQPKYKTCADVECRDPVAFVEQDTTSGGTTIKNGGILDFDFAGKKYSIDCRVARIRSDVIARNKIKEIGDLVGFFDLSNAVITPGTPISVQKLGARTGHTDGIITELFHVNSTGDIIYYLSINPTTTGHISAYNKTFTFQPAEVNDVIAKFNNSPVKAEKVSGTNDKILFKGNVFCNQGDSGSILVYNHGGANKIVGLVTTGTGDYFTVKENRDVEFIPDGNGGAGYILPILNFLRFTDASLIISTGDSSGENILEPGIELDWEQLRPDDRASLLHNLEERIAATRKGKEMINDLQPHAAEVINLVHHRRPVKLSWYRNKGPAFAGMFIKAIENPSGQFAKQIENTSLLQAATSMYHALITYGSKQLCEALEKHGAFLLELFENCSSYDQLVTAVSTTQDSTLPKN